jgi:hypothetical protein
MISLQKREGRNETTAGTVDNGLKKARRKGFSTA